MARNSLAGTKTGKSKTAVYYQENPEAAKRRLKQQKEYASSGKQKKYRAELNKANKKAGTYGNKDGKDYDHAVGGKMVKASINRGRNSKNSKKFTEGDKRARG